MNCALLPGTGGPAITWIAVALICLGAGLLLLRRHRPGRRGVNIAVLLAFGSACLVAQPTVGHAAVDCETSQAPEGAGPPGDLVITQTSVIAGLSPTTAPVAIEGIVTNPTNDSTYVTDVTVRITSVTQATGAAAGTCTTADYVLVDPRMPVNQPLPELSTVPFEGATLSFRNTSRNQDACKRATVHLGYVSSSR